jgi:hypothetical protein
MAAGRESRGGSVAEGGEGWLQGVRAGGQRDAGHMHEKYKVQTLLHVRHTSHVTRHTFLDPLVAVAKHPPPQAREIHSNLHTGVNQRRVAAVEQHVSPALRCVAVKGLQRQQTWPRKRPASHVSQRTSHQTLARRVVAQAPATRQWRNASTLSWGSRCKRRAARWGRGCESRDTSHMLRQMRVTLHAG